MLCKSLPVAYSRFHSALLINLRPKEASNWKFTSFFFFLCYYSFYVSFDWKYVFDCFVSFDVFKLLQNLLIDEPMIFVMVQRALAGYECQRFRLVRSGKKSRSVEAIGWKVLDISTRDQARQSETLPYTFPLRQVMVYGRK